MIKRITIAGDIGSGKSTIARIVAESFGIKALSTGGIQRELAASKGIDTITLNRLAESDPSIDAAIDAHLRALPKGSLVVESRMAWRFVPNTLKVFLYVRSKAAAERVFSAARGDEAYSHQQAALDAIYARRMSEIQRFSKYYGVDISDLKNYHLVIDTTHVGPELVVDKILSQDERPDGTKMWLSPLDLIPTRQIGDLQEKRVLDILEAIKVGNFECVAPVSVVYVDHIFYIIDGHARVAAAAKAGFKLIPALLSASDGEEYISGLTAESYVRDSVSKSLIDDWEDAVGIKYKYPIPEWSVPRNHGTANPKRKNSVR